MADYEFFCEDCGTRFSIEHDSDEEMIQFCPFCGIALDVPDAEDELEGVFDDDDEDEEEEDEEE